MLCFIIGALNPGQLKTIDCIKHPFGRYVAIYFDHPGILTVCEFEVYGGKHLW